jgi:hypothetical protein
VPPGLGATAPAQRGLGPAQGRLRAGQGDVDDTRRIACLDTTTAVFEEVPAEIPACFAVPGVRLVTVPGLDVDREPGGYGPTAYGVHAQSACRQAQAGQNSPVALAVHPGGSSSAS